VALSAAARAGFFGLLVLAGCSGGPTVLDQTPDHVELRWYQWQSTGLTDAEREAGDRCRRLGRQAAVLEEVSADGDVSIARYACR
jgi:hypothetical protein